MPSEEVYAAEQFAAIHPERVAAVYSILHELHAYTCRSYDEWRRAFDARKGPRETKREAELFARARALRDAWEVALVTLSGVGPRTETDGWCLRYRCAFARLMGVEHVRDYWGGLIWPPKPWEE